MIDIFLDGHNDFAIWLRVFYGNRINNLTEATSLKGQVDIPRLRTGGLRAQFWSGYVTCPKELDDFDGFPDPIYHKIIHDTLQQIDLIHRLKDAFPRDLQLASSSSDLQDVLKSSEHAIAGMIGLEGLHQIGNSASALRMYYQLGVRYITLTHDCNNRYADAALAARPRHNGLSEAGKELVLEMNRIGLIVDLSHVTANTMRDTLRISRAPVIFSHSNAYNVCQHVRNVPDDVLLMVSHNGGIVMVTFYPEYLCGGDPASASVQDVVDNIMYIGQLIGYEHVGIGSDFDGMANGPNGLEDVSKYPNLLIELSLQGLGLHDLENVMGRNVLRVLRNVEMVSRAMGDVQPLEDTVWPSPEIFAVQ
ncbi:MAG: hypothetical protein Q9165_008257 [Trypethelium subeluteriae]